MFHFKSEVGKFRQHCRKYNSYLSKNYIHNIENLIFSSALHIDCPLIFKLIYHPYCASQSEHTHWHSLSSVFKMQIWEINYILWLIKGTEKWLIWSNSNPISDANIHFWRRLEHSFSWQLYWGNWINRSMLIQTTLETRYWSDKVNNIHNCVHSFQLTTKSSTQHTQVNKTVEWFSVSATSWHRNAKSVWRLTEPHLQPACLHAPS